MPDSGPGNAVDTDRNTLPAAAGPSSYTARRSVNVTAERRRQMIETAAYFLAEKRAFRDGDPTQDWLQAEAQIDRRLARMSDSPIPPFDPKSLLEHLELELWGFDACVEQLTQAMSGADAECREAFEARRNIILRHREAAATRLRDLGSRYDIHCAAIRAATHDLWQAMRHDVDELAAFVALTMPGARLCSETSAWY